MNKMNCWDFFKCGRDVFSQNRTASVCNVSIIQSNHGVNDGSNSGRYCWRIYGSFCEEKRGTVRFKEKFCNQCGFKKMVRDEEGDGFQDS